MKINKAIENYHKFLRSEDKAKSTINNYMCGINKFVEVNNILTTDDINTDKIAEFRNRIIEAGISGTTFNVYMAGIRSFLLYLYEAEHIQKDYTRLKICKSFKDEKAKTIRGERQYGKAVEDDVGKIITAEHQKLILETAEQMRYGSRNRMILEVALVCGFRVVDLVRLRVSSLTLKQGIQEKI